MTSPFGDRISILGFLVRSDFRESVPLFKSLSRLTIQNSSSLSGPPLLYSVYGFLVLQYVCFPLHLCSYPMGKTPASTRAGRKAKSKNPERKWCTCQERCNGGREVAASTYRSHNPTTTRASAVRGVGGKRKAGYDADGVESEGGLRETRRMRAMRVAVRNGEVMAPLSVTATEDRTGTPELDGAQPQETKMVS